MKRYLKTEFFPQSEEEMNIILFALRTTIEREPIIDAEGMLYVEILSDQELAEECICLGGCAQQLLALGIESTFDVTVVELEEPPVGV